MMDTKKCDQEVFMVVNEVGPGVAPSKRSGENAWNKSRTDMAVAISSPGFSWISAMSHTLASGEFHECSHHLSCHQRSETAVSSDWTCHYAQDDSELRFTRPNENALDAVEECIRLPHEQFFSESGQVSASSAIQVTGTRYVS